MDPLKPPKIILTCPRCGRNVERVRRRFYDRWINRFVRVRRYSCERCKRTMLLRTR